MTTSATGPSLVQQMIADGSLPDMPPSSVPMRAVVAAASTVNPDKEAQTQQLAQQAGMPVDLTRSNPQAAQQRATAADLDRRDLEIRNPILARQLEDPDFAGVAHDDLDSLSRIEEGAATLRATTQDADRLTGLTPTQRQAVIEDRVRAAMAQYQSGGGNGVANKAWAESKSVAGNINAGFFGAFKPMIDGGVALAENLWNSPKPLVTGLMSTLDGEPDFDDLKDVWTAPRTSTGDKVTGPALNALTSGVLPGPQPYLVDPATQKPFKNPDYRWWGRSGVVNPIEQVPGQLAAFLLGGKGAGAAGEAADLEGAALQPGEAAAPTTSSLAAAVERQTVPAVLGTQSAENAYAAARAKGVDQKTAVMAALSSGLTNYGLMGLMPGGVQPSSVLGAAGQWASRSAVMGSSMAIADNVIARSYDPDRSLLEGVPQSIATMAAFEGVGAAGQFGDEMSYQRTVNDMIDAAQASKLRGRSPDAFQQAMDGQFEGDAGFRVPAQDFVNYFAGKKMDPAMMANRLGVANLEEAAAAGSDLEIPKANFFARLDPEHARDLLPDLVDPVTDITGRQAEAGKAELQDWLAKGGVEKLQAEYAQADAETQATPEWKQVYGELKQRYENAGETEAAADSYATLHANAYANLAKKAGLKPGELLAMHNPDIVAGAEAPGVALNQAAYHGSPYRFDQFSLDHLGDGEGAQAFGYGLYFAGDKEIAEHYRQTLGANRPLIDGKPIDPTNPEHVAAGALAVHGGDHKAAVEDLQWTVDHSTLFPDGAEEIARKAIAAIESGKDLPKAETHGGQLYEADIPDAEHMLDWDKPVSQQTAHVQQALSKSGFTGHEDMTGEDVYRDLSEFASGSDSDRWEAYGLERPRNDAGASAHLNSLGIAGIKYLDGNSRKKGDGHHNYVVFDDKAIKVLRTFYQSRLPIDDASLRAAAPKAALDKLEAAKDAITSFASRKDEWNLLPGIRAAVARLGGVEAEGEPANPVVDALAKVLGGDPKKAQTAFEKYAKDSDLNQTDRATTTNDAFDAFNRAFGSKLKPEEFHNALEEAAQRQNTAGDADLHGTAARDQGDSGEEAPGGAESAGRQSGGEPGSGGRSGVPEPATAGEHAADDGVSGKRGWFRMLPDGRYEIGKAKIGDFSTFIHEPAHAYLEMFRELTQRDGASQALKDDFKKICDWLGTTPEDAYKNGFTREQHERWARGNEQYARDGNAPTSGLKRAFHNFSVWLGSIYRRASALGVELSPEIRGVMDRLYAGEEAVNRAEMETPEKLFKSPEEAGWTDEEYKRYAESKGLEVSEAKTQLIREMHEAWLRERTQAWREEKGNARDAVTEEIDKRPEYTAIRSLRKGKLDDGTDLSLNRDALISQFGEDRVKALQKLHPGLYRQEGGTDGETAAELLGFGSGEEMMRALQATPRRSQAIETATREYMTAKHGDVRYDGSLDSKARLAMENDERAKNLHSEVKALRARVATLEGRAADSKAAMRAIEIQPLEHYQEAARQMVDSKAIADLQPNRYLNASRMFSREAFDAVRRGDAAKAAEAKNKELLNHFLFREASAARDYADKFESYAKRMQSRGIQQRLGLADVQSGKDYRDQFNWLLARYGLTAPMQRPDRSLRAWAEDVYGAGNEPAIAPQILNESRFGDYRNVPLSEVRNLHDALVNVRHLAMQEFKMFVQGKQVDFANAKQAMIAAARENLRVKPEKVFEENRTAGERVGDAAAKGDAALMRMERLQEWLDGGKSGPWHDNIFNLAADAQGDEYTMQHQVTSAVTDALADMPADMRDRLWTEKVSVEGIPEPLTRRRMLSIAFNMGNEGNLDRLQKTFDSFGWDRDAITKIGGMLTREEWGFVQKAWDSLRPLGERMRELEKRLTGLPPAMVKVTPFKVALDDGTEMDLDGGYYPIKMDPRYSDKGLQQEAKDTAQNAMQSGYVRATTSRGYTKERTGFGGPLLLDYERVLTDHVSKVAKDLSHREFMLSSQRLLLDTEVRKTLRETLGPAYEAQFMPWLRTIINDRNGSVEQGLGTVSNAMQTLRGNMVAASIGFKVSTALLQITHAPRMLLYARPGSVAQSLVDFLARPGEMTRENQELSPNEMRFRGDSLDRDVRAVLREPSYKEGFARKAAEAARWTLATVDHLFSHTLWRAAYRDGLEKYSDLSESEAQKKAIYEADSAVRLGLGTSAPKDLPAIMRNNDFNKMITTLYGFHNGVYNQLRDNAHQFRYGGSVGKLTYATLLTAIVPALLGNLVTGEGPKDGENPGLWAAKRALLFSADTVPLLGSLAHVIGEGRDMKFTPLENMFDKGGKAILHATTPNDEKDWLGIGLDAAEAGGEALGVPGSGQLVKTLRYVKRAHEGKIENPSLWGALAGGH